MLNNINKIFNHIIYNDVAEPWQIGFQDGAAPNFTGIVELHNNIFFFLIVILIGVSWMLGTIIYFYNSHHNSIVYKYLNHGTIIETIWTITPALILIAIAFPSFRLLYLMDEVISPTITIKVTGNQWFWSYEYSDYVTESGDSIEFDSYMVPESDLELGQFRLLETDNHVIIPTDTHIRLIVTAADVLHDYAVPSLGIKIDACPGRLNQASLLAERTGTFYGQCSEICGVYHGFMPTVIEAVSTSDYLNWIDSVSIIYLGFFNPKSFFDFLIKCLNKIQNFLNILLNKIYANLYVYIGIFFVSFILYNKFNSIINSQGFVVFFSSLIISFLYSNYILDKMEYSNNNIIRNLKNFYILFIFGLLITFFFVSLYFIYNYMHAIDFASDLQNNNINGHFMQNPSDSVLNNNNVSNPNKDVIHVTNENVTGKEYYNFKVEKKVADNFVHSVGEAAKIAATTFIPNTASGLAAGTIGAAVLKATAGLPPTHRATAVAGSMVIGAAATTIGMNIGKNIAKTADIGKLVTDSIKSSPHSNPDPNIVPSPTDINFPNFSKYVEDISVKREDSPLFILLVSMFTLNIFTFIVITSLLIIIFNAFILKSNLEFLSSFIKKFFPKKIFDLFNKWANYSSNFNNRFLLLIFITNTFLIYFILFWNIYASAELVTKFEEYIAVHNYIHNKESILILLWPTYFNQFKANKKYKKI